MTSPTRIYIGFDLGRKCGVAVWREGELVESWAWEFKAKKGMLVSSERDKFRHEVKRLLEAYSGEPIGPTIRPVAAYERPHMRGYGATKSLMGWVCSLEEVCDSLGVELKSVHTGTLKKFATGFGKASKEEMVKAARKLKPDVKSEDEADAIHVAHWAAETIRKGE